MRQVFRCLATIPVLMWGSGHHAEAAGKGGTYYVGTCKPGKADYSTITSAINAVGTQIPAGSTIDICPGIYYEQIVITQPMTLQAVQIGNSSQVVIAPPASAPVSTVPTYDNLIALVAVSNSSGPVNLTGLTIDGTGFLNGTSDTGGIFYDSSSGVINHVVVQNFAAPSQSNYEVAAITIRDDNGLSPTVTVENSSLSFPNGTLYNDYYGLDSGIGNTFNTSITLTASSNVISNADVGIFINGGVNATISGNLIVGAPGETVGVGLQPTGTVKIENNSISNFQTGLQVSGIFQEGPITITGNSLATYDEGIYLITSSAAVTITGNELASLPNAPSIQGLAARQIGVDVVCQQNPTISGNRFINNLIALNNVLPGASLQSSAGTYLGVPTIEALCY